MVLVAAVVAVGTIGWVDHLSGPDYGMSLFYLVPVAVTGWWAGRREVAAVALAASSAWFLADFGARSDELLSASLWNATTRLLIFVALGGLLVRVRRDQHTLERLLEREQKLSRTDNLTGLANRRAFHDALETELARARRGGRPLCVMYLDVDNFKRVNDVFGHAAGDAVLSAIATAIKSAVRSTDVVARLGGDEFAVLMWEVDAASVVSLAQRIVDRVGELAAEHPGSDLGMSAGVVYFEDPPSDALLAVQQADEAMYDSKRSGKGKVTVTTFRASRPPKLARADGAQH